MCVSVIGANTFTAFAAVTQKSFFEFEKAFPIDKNKPHNSALTLFLSLIKQQARINYSLFNKNFFFSI